MNYLRPLLAVLVVFAAAGSADASTTISVKDAWIRLAPPGAMMLAGYAELHNEGNTAVSVTAASSDAFIEIEIHRTVEEDGVARMRPVDAVDLAPGASQALQPGGMHLMLMQPRREISEGSTIVIDLVTASGDVIPAVFRVRRAED